MSSVSFLLLIKCFEVTATVHLDVEYIKRLIYLQIVKDDSDTEEEIKRKTFTLKQLIRKLHITEPVEHVMCLIGKRYLDFRALN